MHSFSEGQLAVLEQGARGHHWHYETKWVLPIGGRPVGCEVAALKRKGLVEITTYASGPGMSWTAEGRKVRQELGFA